MNRWSDLYAPLIGRILMGGFFLWNGIQATLNFPAATTAIAAAGLPMPTVFALLAIIIEVIGGIAVVVGFSVRSVALVLAIFTIAVAFLHIDPGSELLSALFLQNMAIVGGLLYISAFGSGELTVRLRRRRL